ncbi:MAG: hypothetical protein KDI56_02900, partial [Xanthomonadales bacterium]|nr:hypothetical protein [Xanthomonadales bacterium]
MKRNRSATPGSKGKSVADGGARASDRGPKRGAGQVIRHGSKGRNAGNPGRATAHSPGETRERPSGPAAVVRPTQAKVPASTSVRLVTVPEDRDGQRIDNFLLGQLKGVPRSLIYRLLRTGQVRVDGKRAKAELKLSAGQNVRIPPVKEAVAGAPLPAPERLLSSLESSVLFEDEQILVLNKPSGLASHGGSGLS